MYRLQELETRATRDELKLNPEAVLARAAEGIDQASAVLAQAGEALQAARVKRETLYQRIAALNQEFSVVSASLKNSRQLALDGDVNVMWKESSRNRERKSQLEDLLAYNSEWLLPAAAIELLECEIAVEEAKANLLESQCTLDRAKVYKLTLAVREADAGGSIDLSGSASARILKTVERQRREIIPEMELKLQGLKEKQVAAHLRLASTLFS